MNACLWCDDPCGSEKLCATCAAVNALAVTTCAVNPEGHGRTLGPVCSTCEMQREAEDRRRTQNAPIIAALQAIRAQHVRDFHQPWPGLEHGKAIFGQMVDRAIAELESK